jgi:predicted ester cyclase
MLSLWDSTETGMAETENKQMVQRLYREGWGQGDLEVIDRAFATPHILRWNEQTQTVQERTTEELKAIISSYRAAFPDLKVTIDAMVAEGDRVAIQVTFEGTHINTYEGFQPTRKRSRFTDMQILTFRHGKVVETTLGSGGLRYFFGILDGSVLNQ